MSHLGANYYIFTINDTEKEFGVRLAEGLWPVNQRTTYVSDLRKGDLVIFYKAGTGNHVFAGTSSIEKLVEKPPKKYVKITNTNLWKKPIDITTILDTLIFIKNKYVYGVYLVNGITKITKKDYDVILTKKDG